MYSTEINKIIVLGGNGFIGSNFIQSICKVSKEVIVVDRSLQDSGLNSNVRFIKNDLTDLNTLDEIFSGGEIVCQFINTTVPSTANDNVLFDVQSNLITNIRLLEYLGTKKISKFLYLSSGGTVYGQAITKNYSFVETDPLKPISAYGITKSTIENYIQFFSQKYKYESLILRPSNIYGPGQKNQKNQGVIAHFLNLVKDNKAIEIWGDGNGKKDYLYVDDLSSITCKLLLNNESGIFNVGSGMHYSVNDIIETIEKVLNITSKIIYMPNASFDNQNFRLNLDKLNNRIGDFKYEKFHEGIMKQWNWILSSSN